MQISQRKLFHKQINPSEECRTQEKKTVLENSRNLKKGMTERKSFSPSSPLYFLWERLWIICLLTLSGMILLSTWPTENFKNFTSKRKWSIGRDIKKGSFPLLTLGSAVNSIEFMIYRKLNTDSITSKDKHILLRVNNLLDFLNQAMFTLVRQIFIKQLLASNYR